MPRDQLAGIAGIADTTAAAVQLAAQACAACRKQKRRCDKLLPACSRCASLQRACDYADAIAAAGASSSSAPTAEDFAALQNKLAEIETRLLSGSGGGGGSPAIARSHPTPATSSSAADAGTLAEPGSEDHRAGGAPPVVTNRFPSVFFLDTDIYKFAGIVPPRPVVDIPIVS